MRETYGLKPDQLGRLMEVAVGGLEVPGAGGTSRSINQSSEQHQLVSLVRTRVEEAERNILPLLKKWALNTEYYADNPFAAWNPRRNTIVRNPTGKGHASQHLHPVSFNLFKSAINAMAARFAATRPQIIIKPGSTQEEVVEASRVAQRVVGEHEWERQSMEETLAEVIPNLLVHGTSVLKVVWNPKGGKYLGRNPVPSLDREGNPIQAQEYDPLTGMFKGATDEKGGPMWVPQVDSFGKPVLKEEWEGQVETSVVLAKDFLVDPNAKTFRTARWCLHRYELSPADIYDKWGVEVGTSGQNGYGDQYSRGMFGHTRRYEDNRGTSTVYELWLRPGTYKFGPNPGDKRTFDKGFVIIATEEALLDAGPNPNDHNEFPFVFIPAQRIPGELYGDTVANSLRMLQNTFNKTGSQITQANDLMGNPKWLLPNGCKVPDQDRTNKAGTFMRFEAGLQGEKPEIVPGTGVSPSTWRYFDSARSLFQEISGVREGGLGGGAPGSIESGRALNALVERDVSKLATMGLEIGRGLKRWAWLTLKTIQQHWSSKRSISVVGHYQVAEVMSFGSVDVHESFEVSVVPESVMPQTQGMRQAKADALLDRGLIRPYDYIRRVGEDTAEDFTTESMDVSNARLENAQVRRHGFVSTDPEVMQVEDHALHMEEHRRELLNPTLRRNPTKWRALYEHFQQHEQLASEAAENALAAQSMQAQAMDPQAQAQQDANSGPDIPPTPPPPPGGSLPLG